MSHKHFPHANLAKPCILHHLAVRAAIDINYKWIFLCRVEVLGIYEPIVILELPVGAWNGAEFHFAGCISFQRIGDRVQLYMLFPVCGIKRNNCRSVHVTTLVQEPLTVFV